MRIQFEIKENLPEIIEEILHSDKWQTSVKEELSGRTTVVIRDQAYGSEATIEIYATSIEIKTAWSKYSYRIFVTNDIVWCEYNGAYRGLLEQVLLPTITPKENLLNSDVTESSLYGNEHKKLREYAEDNLKLKQFRRENFNEQKNGTAPFDHPKRVYDEFIKEDLIISVFFCDFCIICFAVSEYDYHIICTHITINGNHVEGFFYATRYSFL